jgi:hypothetical protein
MEVVVVAAHITLVTFKAQGAQAAALLEVLEMELLVLLPQQIQAVAAAVQHLHPQFHVLAVQAGQAS